MPNLVTDKLCMPILITENFLTQLDYLFLKVVLVQTTSSELTHHCNGQGTYYQVLSTSRFRFRFISRNELIS